MKTIFSQKKLNIKKENAKKYLLKYINELKLHFDLDENEIKDIILEIHKSKSRFYNTIKKIKRFILKC